MQMENKHMKKHSTYYVIWEMQIKTTINNRYTTREWLKSKTLTTPNAGKDVKQQKLSFTAGWNAKYLRLLGSFLQN